jgi:GNAT superfamily N-acetyltransferase
VGAEDVDDVLPLMRAYCEFYDAHPTDEALRALSEALCADPVNEGVQLVARDLRGRAVGFATVFWTWETTGAHRLGVMNDLYVAEHARGCGAAEALIRACADAAREHGCGALSWVTAPGNARAQAVYARTGAQRSEWWEYTLAL